MGSESFPRPEPCARPSCGHPEEDHAGACTAVPCLCIRFLTREEAVARLREAGMDEGSVRAFEATRFQRYLGEGGIVPNCSRAGCGHGPVLHTPICAAAGCTCQGFLDQTTELWIEPVGDLVLVRRIPEKEVVKGGIIIPENAREKPMEAVVVQVGQGQLLENGMRVSAGLKAGQSVLIGKYSGTEITVDDVEHILLRQEEILAIVHHPVGVSEAS